MSDSLSLAPPPLVPASAAFVDVLIDGITLAEPRPYTYAVPDLWRGRLIPGMAVLVPFGPRRGVGGYITAFVDEAPVGHAVKEIEDVVTGDVLPTGLAALLPWLADYTMSPMAAVLTTAMPRGTLSRLRRTVHLAIDRPEFARLAADWQGPPAILAARLLATDGGVSAAALQHASRKAAAVLATWHRQGLIRYQTDLENPTGGAKLQLHAILSTDPTAEDLTARQREILDYLATSGGILPITDLAKATGTTYDTLRRLARHGGIALESRAVRRSARGLASAGSAPALTPHQGEVVAAIAAAIAGDPRTFLLQGVTGSGKTEVYLQAIARTLARGKGAIVLVPEIALTPQTLRRFQARFGDLVAVLHSHLSDGERFDEWQRIRSGDAPVVVGARSAVFAPVPHLGLIVIDEEHETSYKQDSVPRYHARVVAEQRARIEGACLILGSATPSVESFDATESGRYVLLSMPDRVENRPLPPVTVVDMREELRQGNRGLFSRRLKEGLAGVMARGEQAILLLNRRGYSSFVFCRSCGYACRCTRCAVAMTYHQNPTHLRCHYCDTRSPVPTICPQCQSGYIRHFGAGTQQIEEATAKLFPEARIVRVDRDTTSRKGSHQVLLDGFGAGEHDILIGTQMVAKGLDFPRVTLVGVMAADGALHLPDFRASERTFQLLTQVAGRAGRGDLASEVVVQTYAPDHPAILAARDHDFAAFYAAEVPDRRELHYPPFVDLVNVIVAGPELRLVTKVAADFARRLADQPDVEVFGPQEAPLALLRGMHRYQVLLKVAVLNAVRPALRAAMAACQQPGIRLLVDLDPYSLL